MPRPVTLDQLPEPLPPVIALVGDEELLVTRGISAVAARLRATSPDLEESERAGSEIEGPELHEMLGPSLFGDARLLVIRAGQDVRTAALAVLGPYLQSPVEGTTIVLHHLGGAKGKAVLEAARKGKALEIGCAKLTRPDERLDFVANEVRRAGGRIGTDALNALVDAVGSDLRELAATAAQLVSDSGGEVTLEIVRDFHKGRAEVSGFAVSDLTVVGNEAGALEALRFAVDVGVPHVVIADALADGIRTIARVASAGRGDAYALASTLGMPPWKVKRAQGQSRGWSEPGVRQALGVVAGLNADVKGAAADPNYALERAIRAIVTARRAS
ncbi:DNA polymerase III subunit delta [Jatrophihabitans sp.]|uniref:DNA polymerase III subunit delta n=1 Tax=Jatrophihabitans sp. TaxID=1932789 RepID=UPI0030C6D4CE|nr:polymerase subunit delta [Jatrophihabitans sp.]